MSWNVEFVQLGALAGVSGHSEIEEKEEEKNIEIETAASDIQGLDQCPTIKSVGFFPLPFDLSPFGRSVGISGRENVDPATPSP
jgi:hypothetical protein